MSETAVRTRTFEKEVRLVTQGQYRVVSPGVLRLSRYRFIADGAAGPWRKVTPATDLPEDIWPRTMHDRPSES